MGEKEKEKKDKEKEKKKKEKATVRSAPDGSDNKSPTDILFFNPSSKSCLRSTINVQQGKRNKPNKKIQMLSAHWTGGIP